MNASGCSLDLWGHPVIAHLFISRFICAQFEYSMSLLSWGWMCLMLSTNMARSFMYAMVLIVFRNILKL